MVFNPCITRSTGSVANPSTRGEGVGSRHGCRIFLRDEGGGRKVCKGRSRVMHLIFQCRGGGGRRERKLGEIGRSWEIYRTEGPARIPIHFSSILLSFSSIMSIEATTSEDHGPRRRNNEWLLFRQQYCIL